MLAGLDQVKWEQYAQPTENAAGEVPAALRALADTGDLDRGYCRLLHAFGNNHAGTYFPVVVPAMPFLGEILRGSSLVARLRTLDVLIDLIGSFSPDPRYREIETSAVRRDLEDLVKEAAMGLSKDVERLLENPEIDEEARLAAALMTYLRA